MLLIKALRVLLWLCAISLFNWAYVDPQFRSAEGVLQGAFCLPITAGVAFIILACALTTPFAKSAIWFAFAVVGQAVALQMIDAGPLVRYQHYKPLSQLIQAHPSLLIFLALQTLLVVRGCKAQWLCMRAWLGRTFKTWQLVGVTLTYVLSSAAVSREVPNYISEMLFATFVQAVNLGNIVLMVWALPEELLTRLQRSFDKLFGQPGVEEKESKAQLSKPVLSHVEGSKIKNSTVDRVALVAAAWVTVLAAVLSYFVYEGHPHVQDEVIYLYHARYFAEGVLTTPAPPVSDAFSLYMLPHESSRWFSIFPPGWPAILSLGVMFGVPWLVNPILAGVNVSLASILIREIYDRGTAFMALLLLCTSPWFIFMGMNFMSHTFTLTCALAAALAMVWARRTGRTLWALLGGLSVGIVGLIRPLDGFVMAALLGLWGVGFGGQRLKFWAFAALVIGCVATNALVLPYNKALTGNPWVSPLTAYYTQYHGVGSNAFGFGPNRGLGWAIDPYPGHSPIEALINASLNTFSINHELFGWSTGSLILIVVLLFCRKLQRNDYLMVAAIVAIASAYSLYWFGGGPDFGARYWFLTLVPLAVLTARGIQFLADSLKLEANKQEPWAQRNFPLRSAVDFQNVRVIVAVASLCFSALVNYFPWRAIDKYYHYLGMRPDIRDLSTEYNFGRSVVLIRGKAHPDYASAWIYNLLDFNGAGPVYAWDRNLEVRAKVLKAYPDRRVWLVDGPTITHGPYRVIEGPKRAQELAAPRSAFSRSRD